MGVRRKTFLMAAAIVGCLWSVGPTLASSPPSHTTKHHSTHHHGAKAAHHKAATTATREEAPVKYAGQLKGTLDATLRHAKVPTELVRQACDAARRDPSIPHLSSGTYELLAVRRGHRLQLVETHVRVGQGDHRVYRYLGAISPEWVDGQGKILTQDTLVRPVEGGRMSSGFGWRVHPVLGDRRFHNGVDFALPKGSPVFAAESGVVGEIGYHGNYGRLVRIKQGVGGESVYAHLNGFAKRLKVGQHVTQGQLIGFVGETGLATGPHLYWEVVKDGDHVDPLRLLAEQPKHLPPAKMNKLLHYVATLEKTAQSPDPAAVAHRLP